MKKKEKDLIKKNLEDATKAAKDAGILKKEVPQVVEKITTKAPAPAAKSTKVAVSDDAAADEPMTWTEVFGVVGVTVIGIGCILLGYNKYNTTTEE